MYEHKAAEGTEASLQVEEKLNTNFDFGGFDPWFLARRRPKRGPRVVSAISDRSKGGVSGSARTKEEEEWSSILPLSLNV